MNNGDEVSVLEGAVLEAFAFLTREFGFRHRKTAVASPEVAVFFENDTTLATIHVEPGSFPWVELGKRDVAQSYSLEFVRELRQWADPKPSDLAEWSTEDIIQRLKAEADSLRSVAADILRGDFSCFPELRALAERSAERRNRELFGDEN